MDAHFASALRDDAMGEKRRFVSWRAAKGGDLCPAGVSNLLVGKEWMDCFGADAPRNDTSRFLVFHLTHNLLVLPVLSLIWLTAGLFSSAAPGMLPH